MALRANLNARPLGIIYLINLACDVLDEESLLTILAEIPNGIAKTTFVRTGWSGYIDSERESKAPKIQEFNTKLGDLIREGADYTDLKEETTEEDIVRYVICKHAVRDEEEKIGWEPITSTSAGKIYKNNLETLVSDAFEMREPEKPRRLTLRLLFDMLFIGVVLAIASVLVTLL